MPLLESLGQRIRALRITAGMTVRELAAAAGLSVRFLSEVEAGRGNISITRLAALAQALGVEISELLVADGTPGHRSIALLGLRGAGKTTVGKRLARRLKLPFVELDTLVAERAGMSLSEVFSLYGEDYYRQVERAALAEILSDPQPKVIATGGGLVTAGETFALLQRHATTVWLKARSSDYWNRVVRQGDQRPMTDHPQAREALRDLVSRRDPLYSQATLTVDTAGLTVAQTVDRVARVLEERPQRSKNDL
jgi:XRE family aerobic/anaerobic benzoate catabolism transcriptional regulator